MANTATDNIGGETEAQFPVAPAPWLCKGEFFSLLGYVSSSAPYPSGAAFADLEAESSCADPKITGEFKGGLMHVMIVRYTDTPVGPYDELIFSPGKFVVPPTGEVRQRITRIYVSSTTSIYNGRKNWNIPKHLAHFTFTPVPNHAPSALPYSRVAVASPSHPEEPFFAVDLTPTMFLSRGSIPYNSASIPINQDMAHPPLPQSLKWREDAMVGTDSWCSLPLLMKGKAGFFWHKGGLEGGKYGDNEGYPDVKPWSLGMWLRDFELDFTIGKHFGEKDE